MIDNNRRLESEAGEAMNKVVIYTALSNSDVNVRASRHLKIPHFSQAGNPELSSVLELNPCLSLCCSGAVDASSAAKVTKLRLEGKLKGMTMGGPVSSKLMSSSSRKSAIAGECDGL